MDYLSLINITLKNIDIGRDNQKIDTLIWHLKQNYERWMLYFFIK